MPATKMPMPTVKTAPRPAPVKQAPAPRPIVARPVAPPKPAPVQPSIGAKVPGVPISDPYMPRPTGNFQGDTSVPNMNTIGATAPTTGGFNTPNGQFDASNAAPLPPGAVYKKGGYVKGGKLNLGSGRVSTASKNKSNPNW
jgi:hypothetical protein